MDLNLQTPEQTSLSENTLLSSLKSIFHSRYSHCILPLLYFFIMILVAMFNRPIGGYDLETDFYWAYAPQAKELLKGILIVDGYKGPVYQVLLAVFGFIFGNEFYQAGKFLNVLCTSVSLFFISLIIDSISDKKYALLVVLFVITNSVFIKYTYEPGTDMIFLAFYTSALYFVLKNKEAGRKDLFIAGVLSGIAYLTRYTAVSLILTVLLIFFIKLIINFRRGEQIQLKKEIINLTFYMVPVIIFISAWGIICLQKTGDFFYNLNYLNTAQTVYKPGDINADNWTLNFRPAYKSFSDVIFQDPSVFLYKIFVVNFTSSFVNDLTRLVPIYTGVFVAAGLFLFIIKFRTQNTQQKKYFLFSLIFYIQIIFTFYSERFSLPLLPFYFFVLVKLSDYNFLQKINFGFRKIRLFTIIPIVLITFSLNTSIQNVKETLNQVPVEILNISEILKQNPWESGSDKIVMARKPHIAFYLDMKFEVTPYSRNLEELQKFIKEKNVDYLYVSLWESSLMNPQLRSLLLNSKNPPEGLEVLVNLRKSMSILYKVKK